MVNHAHASAIASASPDELLGIEANSTQAGRFSAVDECAAGLLRAALSGSYIIQIAEDEAEPKQRELVTLPRLAPSERAFIDAHFALSAQQSRGAWFLPETARLRAQTVNLAAHLRHHPMHAVTLATEDVARVRFSATPESLLLWALLIPLFDVLLQPIIERTKSSAQTAEDQRANWLAITREYQHLGINAGSVMWAFSFRGGWADLDRAGQVRARIALLDGLASHDPLQIVRRFRAGRIAALARRTMEKARRTTPLARQALTKRLHPTLSAYFGGGWLAFLEYLELPPHPNEEVITALPEPRFYVGGAAKASKAAAEHGVELDDVHAMLAAFLDQETPVSPVEQRVEALQRWWQQFDAVHARQAPGMPALWGLVEETAYSIGYGNGPTPQLYQQLLAPELVEEVNHLWDGITLPRWPHAVVSEPYPHRLMADTLGPAVSFWHGVALTTWYICEGPASRTTLAGLRGYHERDLASLKAAGTPIHLSLFDELRQAEHHLGPPQELETHEHQIELPEGRIGIRISGGGQRRDGFEMPRDIVTRHRRGWANRYLSEYLRHLWTQELTTVTRELNKVIAVKGKPPTFRQFARFAATPANHWFNGDLAGLYTAIGEKAPATSARVDLLPIGAHDFVNAVYAALGGKPYEEQLRISDFPTADRYRQLSKLAAASVYYIQITEALGRPPTPTEFGAKRFEWDWSNGIEPGWPIYQRAIDDVLAAST